MTGVIEHVLGELKKLQTNSVLKQQVMQPLNNQLSQAGLDHQEKRVIIGYCINAETSDALAAAMSISKDQVNSLYDSATSKLYKYQPLSSFVKEVDDYRKEIPA